MFVVADVRVSWLLSCTTCGTGYFSSSQCDISQHPSRAFLDVRFFFLRSLSTWHSEPSAYTVCAGCGAGTVFVQAKGDISHIPREPFLDLRCNFLRSQWN